MEYLEYYLNKTLTSYYFQDSSIYPADDEISKEDVTNLVVFFSIISIIGSILFSLLIATFCWFRYYYRLSLVNNKITIRARIRNIPDIESQFTEYYYGDEKDTSEKQGLYSDDENTTEPLAKDSYSGINIHTGDFVVLIQDVPNKDSTISEIHGSTLDEQLIQINRNFTQGSTVLNNGATSNYMDIGDLLKVSSYNEQTNKLTGSTLENKLIYDNFNIMLQEKPDTEKQQQLTKEVSLDAVTLGCTVLKSFEVVPNNGQAC